MTVLVTGAAGDQGAAAIRHMREAGHAVRALDAASPDSPRAQYLAELGATYIQGDVADQETVDQAMAGVTAVLAVPVGPYGDELVKADLGTFLISSAERAGVEIFVQTTVAALERHLVTGDYGTGYTADEYAAARLRIEARLRTSTLKRWVLLRPVALMENFLPPKAHHMFPWLSQGRLDSVHAVDVPLQLVSVVDIARFTVAALAEPDRFDRQSIELCGDELGIDAIADAISTATGTTVTQRTLTVSDAVNDGMIPGVAHSQEWVNKVGYAAARPEEIHRSWGIKPTSFTDWADAHAELFDVPRRP
ncbi:NmrA family NAD(P)-binding protein [Streptomyces sp. NPDC101234]|uniref:NmrA family NAD(P)-binding protein n=1 Tax=Streptomyces sp. NPDC101234 TaxID=3366138 RepID=UPI003809842D